MKEFVKVAITRVDNIVLFKVLEQDENVIKRGEFKMNVDGVDVLSTNLPTIWLDSSKCLDKIHLKGTSEITTYNGTDIARCYTIEEADSLCKQIRSIINKLNEKLSETESNQNKNKFEIVNY